MGDLSKNLSRHEFACRCGCGYDTVDFGTVVMIQGAVDHFSSKFNAPAKVDIRGGNRCKKHNEFVQKKYNPKYIAFSSKSTHMDAKAGDIKIFCLKGGDWIQVDPNEVYDYFDKKYPKSAGVGKYHNRTHVDSRNKKARWTA
ncbi:MAG: hypothetical protein COB61_011515 [Thiotrichales bacterium]|nr:hypothetical protein [Thiotrichales bacterium]